jgi:hypothetical protein
VVADVQTKRSSALRIVVILILGVAAVFAVQFLASVIGIYLLELAPGNAHANSNMALLLGGFVLIALLVAGSVLYALRRFIVPLGKWTFYALAVLFGLVVLSFALSMTSVLAGDAAAQLKSQIDAFLARW